MEQPSGMNCVPSPRVHCLREKIFYIHEVRSEYELKSSARNKILAYSACAKPHKTCLWLIKS